MPSKTTPLDSPTPSLPSTLPHMTLPIVFPVLSDAERADDDAGIKAVDKTVDKAEHLVTPASASIVRHMSLWDFMTVADDALSSLPIHDITSHDITNGNTHASDDTPHHAADARDRAYGLILYFYPRDNTAGCTTQAQDFSHAKSALAMLGFRVLGVSCDSVASHQRFIAKRQLEISLASDVDQALCQHFGIIQQKKLYGKTYLGIVRTTLVFAADGTLLHRWDNVKAKGHVDTLINYLQDLAV